ncbi:MAG: pimelyl-ACP methyl ester esterase BioV [Helicobacteraceae bacterium]|nr:pimelyl-ACP methyl ester esterase BioV [Helicobacteraceae bacterium]
MKFFSGFTFTNEEALFEEFLEQSEYNVAGFSYGAQKALEYTFQSNDRIDKLQLFSPAFFQTFESKFKKLQLLGFKKNSDSYIELFRKNSFLPLKSVDNSYFSDKGSFEELKELLEYRFDESKLQAIVDRGIKIEIYLGSEDKVIDVESAREFFKNYGSVYYIKGASHLLQTGEINE